MLENLIFTVEMIGIVAKHPFNLESSFRQDDAQLTTWPAP